MLFSFLGSVFESQAPQMGHGASIPHGYGDNRVLIATESQRYLWWGGELWLQDRATGWCSLACWECGRPGAIHIMVLGIGAFDSLECRDLWHDRFSMVPCAAQGARLAPARAPAA